MNIRWIIRRDLPQVLEIERFSSKQPWIKDDFLQHLRQYYCIGLVAEEEDKVLGFMIYKLYENRLDIIKFVVHPTHRRQGIGTKFIVKLIHKLRENRIYISTNTHEDSLSFFQALGFKQTENQLIYEPTEKTQLLLDDVYYDKTNYLILADMAEDQAQYALAKVWRSLANESSSR